MDLAYLVGFVLGVVMVVFGIIVGGGKLGDFVDPPSVIITIGGSLAATLMTFKLPDFINGLKGFTIAFKEPSVGSVPDTIQQIIDLANVSRKEGLLALEDSTRDLDDEFLRKGVMLVVDGTDPELVRSILETELSGIETRHKGVIAFFEKWAEMGPAWGMIGTLIGLVNMLQNMEDASTIGPAMAVALLTTLYGSLIANWLAGPTGVKLKVNNDLEIAVKTVTVEGLLSIQAGENPRVIEEKLKTFMAPKDRASVGEGSEGGGE